MANSELCSTLLLPPAHTDAFFMPCVAFRHDASMHIRGSIVTERNATIVAAPVTRGAGVASGRDRWRVISLGACCAATRRRPGQ